MKPKQGSRGCRVKSRDVLVRSRSSKGNRYGKGNHKNDPTPVLTSRTRFVIWKRAFFHGFRRRSAETNEKISANSELTRLKPPLAIQRSQESRRFRCLS